MCVLGCGWVVEWVLDKWHSLYDNTHYKHEYSVLNFIWPKSGLSEFWKNPLHLKGNLISVKVGQVNFSVTKVNAIGNHILIAFILFAKYIYNDSLVCVPDLDTLSYLNLWGHCKCLAA